MRLSPLRLAEIGRIGSIRGRLTLWFTGLFGVIVVALALTAYSVVRKQVYSKLDTALGVATGATAMSAEHELNEHPDKSGGESDLRNVLEESGIPDLVDTQILLKDRGRVVAFKRGSRGSDLRTLATEQLSSETTVDGLRISVRQFPVPRFNTTYEICAATPVAPAVAQMARLRTALMIFIPVGLLVAAAGAYALATRSLKPLQEFALIVDAVTSSDLSARVRTEPRGDEINRLALRFNALLDRLEHAFALQRRFMADASHQIRTPVTVALVAAQVSGREASATTIDLRESLSTIEKQMLQLRRIVDDMFFLSQTDTTALRLELREVYLDDVVAEAVRAAMALAREKNQIIRLHGLPEARCLGDLDLLTQAVLILLDNATKFTPAHGSIGISIERRAENWICAISDNGHGIPEQDQERIFERFFQVKQRTADARKGAGLGLAIAKSIMESHGGNLSLAESRPGCTIFELSLPAMVEGVEAVSTHANCPAVRM